MPAGSGTMGVCTSITAMLRALMLLAAMSLGGCAVLPNPEFVPQLPIAYEVICNIRSSPTPYYVYERGKTKRLYGANASVYLFSLIWPVEGSQMQVYLFDHVVQPWDCWSAYTLALGDRQRRIGPIFDLAEGVSPVPFWIDDIHQEKATVRWIIGNDPFIVAIGTDVVPIRVSGGGDLTGSGIQLGKTYAMVREGDLDNTATELIVLDEWPPEWRDTGSEWEKQFVEQLAKVTRRIKLEQPMTLRNIMAEKAWERATVVP
jgi:hypothetical protein